MSKEEERELKRGEKAYFKRLINEFTIDKDIFLNDIKKLRNRLLVDTETKPSVQTEINGIIAQFEEKEKKLNELYDTIFEADIETGESLAERIEEFVSEYQDAVQKLSELHSKIEKYERSLFGYVNEDGEKIGGTQDRISAQIKKLDSLYSENKEKQANLYQEIEGLLKGASTVALSLAFKEHKDSFNRVNNIWLLVFICSITAMMGLSVWAFNSADYDPSEMWKYTLGNLPFLAGAIWLAIYSSKQRSQNKRLQQEYAFKEDVAKIYYGLKKEIEELGETELGKKLNESVLKILVDVVSLNPSQTLDNGSHNEKGPIMEALNSIKSMLPNK